MKVRCLRKKLKDLKSAKERAFIARTMRISEKAEYAIKVGDEYTVYGITFWDRIPFYSICGEDPEVRVIFVPASFFETVDPRPSQYWRFHYRFCFTSMSDFNFPEWNRDPWFYEKLVEGNADELQIFSRYKSLMDAEFDPQLEIKTAKVLYLVKDQSKKIETETHSNI